MAGPQPEAQVITLGCRLNSFESQVIRQQLAAAGRNDAIVVNTCAVTGEAERQARQTIRRLRRQHPEAELIVTGCAAQIHPEAFAEMPEVSRVLGNREKLSRDSYGPEADGQRIAVTDIFADDGVSAPPLIGDFGERARAFVQVQQGCDHRCTFCIIPYGRGGNQSLDVATIIAQVQTLVATGHNEVVLSGVDLTSWGDDLPATPRLGDMVARVLEAVPALPRLRLSSLDPAALDDTLLGLLAEHPRLMPHVHLSLQAGDDLVLKRMKRRHNRAQALELCHRLRAARPGLTLGADVIAGFPTEDEAMFKNTLRLVDEAPLTFLHVFPYSPRAGTPAAKMPAVPMAERKARAAQLRVASDAVRGRYLASRVGGHERILVEQDNAGHSEAFARARLAGATLPSGTIAEVRVVGVADDTLLCEALP